MLVLMSLTPVIAVADAGCCVNPKNVESLCLAVDPSACCPSPAKNFPRIYGENPAANAEQACRDTLFRPGSCSSASECQTGCCCPDGTVRVKAACSGSSSYYAIESGKKCDQLCREKPASPPPATGTTPATGTSSSGAGPASSTPPGSSTPAGTPPTSTGPGQGAERVLPGEETVPVRKVPANFVVRAKGQRGAVVQLWVGGSKIKEWVVEDSTDYREYKATYLDYSTDKEVAVVFVNADKAEERIVQTFVLKDSSKYYYRSCRMDPKDRNGIARLPSGNADCTGWQEAFFSNERMLFEGQPLGSGEQKFYGYDNFVFEDSTGKLRIVESVVNSDGWRAWNRDCIVDGTGVRGIDLSSCSPWNLVSLRDELFPDPARPGQLLSQADLTFAGFDEMKFLNSKGKYTLVQSFVHKDGWRAWNRRCPVDGRYVHGFSGPPRPEHNYPGCDDWKYVNLKLEEFRDPAKGLLSDDEKQFAGFDTFIFRNDKGELRLVQSFVHKDGRRAWNRNCGVDPNNPNGFYHDVDYEHGGCSDWYFVDISAEEFSSNGVPLSYDQKVFAGFDDYIFTTRPPELFVESVAINSEVYNADSKELVYDKGKAEAAFDGRDLVSDSERSSLGKRMPYNGALRFKLRSFSCGNGNLDSGESDVDCGGVCMARCANSRACSAGADCLSDYCASGKCAFDASKCGNRAKDPAESDTDCGSACPRKCIYNQKCFSAQDCESNYCSGGKCLQAECDADSKCLGGLKCVEGKCTDASEYSVALNVNPQSAIVGTVASVRAAVSSSLPFEKPEASLFDESGRKVGKIQIFDDGNHGDGAANDKVYGGVFSTSGLVPGKYSVEFSADVRELRGLFSRSEQKTLNLVQGGVCKELIPGHNLAEGDRVNMVFAGVAYKSRENFIKYARNSVEGPAGLLSLEPFKSGKGKFNFWYMDVLKGDFERYSGSQELQSELNSFGNLCAMPNSHTVFLINAEFRAFANWDGDAYVSYPDFCSEVDSCLKVNVRRGCLAYADGNEPACSLVRKECETGVVCSRVVVHEFGHAFGGLMDEYEEDRGNPLFSIRQKGNCYDVPSRPVTADQCRASAQWSRLIGNGCGSDGVVDCKESDANYNLEVGCHDGCAYHKGVFRSVFNSIMRNLFANPYAFGSWNEKLLGARLGSFSGTARPKALSVSAYHTPETGFIGQSVTITAASDSSDVDKIEIYAGQDSTPEATCFSNTCSYALRLTNRNVYRNYYAVATGKSGNKVRFPAGSAVISIPAVSLVDVSYSPERPVAGSPVTINVRSKLADTDLTIISLDDRSVKECSSASCSLTVTFPEPNTFVVSGKADSARLGSGSSEELYLSVGGEGLLTLVNNPASPTTADQVKIRLVSGLTGTYRYKLYVDGGANPVKTCDSVPCEYEAKFASGRHTFYATVTDFESGMVFHNPNNGLSKDFNVIGGSASDKTPPVVTLVSPGPVVTSTPVRIEVSTDEPAACKIGASDVSFDLMWEILYADAAKKTHTTIWDLTKNFNGKFKSFVKCKDVAGNVNPAGLEVAFTLNLP